MMLDVPSGCSHIKEEFVMMLGICNLVQLKIESQLYTLTQYYRPQETSGTGGYV